MSCPLYSRVFIRRTAHYATAANIYLFANCFIGVLGCTYFSGGLYSPVIWWFATGPVTATLLLGFNRNAIIWLAINSALVLAFGIAAGLGVNLPFLYDVHHADFFFATSQIGLVLTLLKQIGVSTTWSQISHHECALNPRETRDFPPPLPGFTRFTTRVWCSGA